MSSGTNKEELFNVQLSSDSDTGDVKTVDNPFINPGEMRTDTYSSLDPDVNPDEEEEKHRLIAQVMELQNTLDDLSSRVDTVKEENLKLKSENQVLGQYIENLMAASSVFQSTSPKSKKKSSKKKFEQ
ncbi:short coiled-coil protein B-like [Ylistrum balloti]|uniref:short coiled-coil protein B-like n=1 Tax=Ylistrum balloti TaxID=509963 RepID=UPI00290597DB|nr:short coiled-coil protein B-like [Ylistrum balloti]XP_060073332.1 short coiled-coil protein B-like [Ylistrum balloti]